MASSSAPPARSRRATGLSLLFAQLLLASTLPLLAAAARGTEPIHSFCSGRSGTSPPAMAAEQLERFLGTVSSGARRSYSAGENRTVYAVAQCHPAGHASGCAACLAASTRFLVASAASCAGAAVWHERGERGHCFLRYSDRDTNQFREDEHAAALFNPTGVPARHGRAAVAGLLAAVAHRLDCRMQRRRLLGEGGGVGWAAWGAASSSVGRVYAAARCAPGIARSDCGRCLRGAVAVAEREYNGSAGMQVLRLSCTARYESYRFADGISYGYIGGDGDVLPASPPAVHSPPAGTNSTAAPPQDTATQIPAPGPIPFSPALRPLSQAQQSTGHGRASKRTLVLLVVVIATGAAAGSVLLFFFWSHRRRRRRNIRDIADGIPGEEHLNVNEENDDVDVDDEESTSCQPYSYEVLEVATCHFSINNKLGSGGFATVYRGTLEDGKQVAVKRLKDSKRCRAELEREISIVAKLRHKNIVRFLGYCFEDEWRLLVYEYLPNNSLDKFWNRGYFPCKLDWETWFNIIKGVAHGLQFLHGKGIIHRDLKPHNVLLDENFTPKIADFDLVRVFDKNKTHESTEKAAGTLGYMAPECTAGPKFLLSVKSDVYSYGVLVMEIVTGRRIHTFEGNNFQGLVEYVWQRWTEGRVRDVLDGGLDAEAKEQGQRQALRCVHVALLCVQSDRSRRPTMDEIIAMLGARQDLELQAPSLPGYLHPVPASARALRPLPCFGR